MNKRKMVEAIKEALNECEIEFRRKWIGVEPKESFRNTERCTATEAVGGDMVQCPLDGRVKMMQKASGVLVCANIGKPSTPDYPMFTPEWYSEWEKAMKRISKEFADNFLKSPWFYPHMTIPRGFKTEPFTVHEVKEEAKLRALDPDVVIADQHREIKRLQGVVLEYSANLAKKDDVIWEKNARIREWEAVREIDEKRLEEWRKHIAKLEERLKTSKDNEKALHENIADIFKRMAEKDRMMTKMREFQRDNDPMHISELNSMLSAKVNELQCKLDVKQHELGHIRKHCGELEEKVKNQAANIRGMSKKIFSGRLKIELRHFIADLNSTDNRYTDVKCNGNTVASFNSPIEAQNFVNGMNTAERILRGDA